MTQVEFTLLENGLDFIWSALVGLGSNPDEKQLKYAILHLSSGVELLLKERLRREHWSLVFDKPENANRNRYETGDFSSVSFQSSLKRVVEICSINITEEQKKRVTTLRDKRNRLEHFGIVDTVEALTSDAAAALGFVIDFVDSQLSSSLGPSETKTLENIRKKLSDFKVFVKGRLAAIHDSVISANGPVKTCPSCDQRALIISHGVKCVFCHYSRSAQSAAKDYIGEVLNEQGDDWPLFECPSCHTEALVDEGYRCDREYVCFECGRVWKQDGLQSCPVCNKLYDGNSALCKDCDNSKLLSSGSER